MSSEQLLQILLPPANISVLFGLVLAFGGSLFVLLTEYTFEVDPATVERLTGDRDNRQSQQEAKRAIKVYTRDSIWRVSLVSSTLSSFVSLFVMVSTSSLSERTL